MAAERKTVKLSGAEQAELERRVRGLKTPQSAVKRARVILMWAEGKSSEETALEVGLSRNSVYTWRQRFERHRLEGLNRRKSAPRKRKLSAAKAKEILRLTVERIPKNATHWSLRLMAEAAGVTVWQVRQVWEAADLRPHRLRTFKVSNDPQFAEKVVDVVGLYLDPPDNAMVLSVDEKTQIQALDRTQPMLPLAAGRIEGWTHDYRRHGVTSLYAAFDVATGEVIGRVTKRHRAREFLAFLRQIVASTDPTLELHIILDNSSTHKTPAVQAWLEKNPRVHFHFTPTSASWLNAVESWFAILERRAIHRGTFTSVQQLRNEIKRFIRAHNDHSAKPFVWTKSAGAILQSVNRARNAIDRPKN